MRHHKTKLRHIAPPEREELQAMARSRTLETRLTERARLILALEGSRNYAETAREQHVTRVTVYNWIERFNTLGLAGLEDQPRSGRPPIYGSDEKAEVIAAALTKPNDLDLEFGSWTLDRLEVYLNEAKGIAIKRSRIDEILIEEGLRWRKQETWFGEKVDPEFAKKRGLLIASTRRHRRTAS